MKDRIRLYGLKASDYIHPQEAKMKMEDNASLLLEGLNILNDINVSLVKRVTKNHEGNKFQSANICCI